MNQNASGMHQTFQNIKISIISCLFFLPVSMEKYSDTSIIRMEKKKQKKNVQKCEVGQLCLEDMLVLPIATLLSPQSSTHSSKPDTSGISSPDFLPVFPRGTTWLNPVLLGWQNLILHMLPGKFCIIFCNVIHAVGLRTSSSWPPQLEIYPAWTSAWDKC